MYIHIHTQYYICYTSSACTCHIATCICVHSWTHYILFLQKWDSHWQCHRRRKRGGTRGTCPPLKSSYCIVPPPVVSVRWAWPTRSPHCERQKSCVQSYRQRTGSVYYLQYVRATNDLWPLVQSTFFRSSACSTITSYLDVRTSAYTKVYLLYSLCSTSIATSYAKLWQMEQGCSLCGYTSSFLHWQE